MYLQSECYLRGSYRLPVFAYQVMCFYAGCESMSACQQKSVADGWMMGRNSTPKQRALCQCCLDWLVGEGLAECMPLRSDAMLPLHPCCKLLPVNMPRTTWAEMNTALGHDVSGALDGVRGWRSHRGGP